MKLYKKAGLKKNYIVTLAIGKTYLNDWEKYAKPSWIEYCNKYDLGLISINKNLISTKSIYYKKHTWQKFLIGNALKKKNLEFNNICYLDSDILINYNSPNIFDYHKKKNISLVSQFKRLPFNLNLTRKKIALLRNNHYSRKYPIDSALHMSIFQIYKHHNLLPQKDYCCAGLFVFNLEKFGSILNKIYYFYDKNVKSITDGGDETFFNYEMHKIGSINYLNYKFQALWIFEMANHYPYLYRLKDKYNSDVQRCVESSLYNNYFLHFAGSWYESGMWKNKKILNNSFSNNFIKNISKIKNLKMTGNPAGVIKPKN